MQKVIYTLLALCLLQGAYSACSDGTFTTAPVVEAGKAECTACIATCVTCNAAGSCQTGIDKFNGLDRTTTPHTAKCAGATWTFGSVGYNKQKDACSNCMEGCLNCAIDYNVCTKCKNGWDFDRKNFQCLRATLGLAAVVLALSALTLLIGIMTCICACKL